MGEFICNSRCYFNSCDDCFKKLSLIKQDEEVKKLLVQFGGINYARNNHRKTNRNHYNRR